MRWLSGPSCASECVLCSYAEISNWGDIYVQCVLQVHTTCPCDFSLRSAFDPSCSVVEPPMKACLGDPKICLYVLQLMQGHLYHLIPSLLPWLLCIPTRLKHSRGISKDPPSSLLSTPVLTCCGAAKYGLPVVPNFDCGSCSLAWLSPSRAPVLKCTRRFCSLFRDIPKKPYQTHQMHSFLCHWVLQPSLSGPSPSLGSFVVERLLGL